MDPFDNEVSGIYLTERRLEMTLFQTYFRTSVMFILLVIVLTPSFAETIDSNSSLATLDSPAANTLKLISFPTTIVSPGVYQITRDFTDPLNISPLVVLSDNVVIEGGSFILNGTASPGVVSGIVVQAGEGQITNITLKNITVTGYQTGLTIDGVKMMSVENCMFQTNQVSGITISNSSAVTLTKTDVSDNHPSDGNSGGSGLDVSYSDNVSVTHALFMNNGFGDSGSGITASETSSLAFEDCTITGSSDAGIVLINNVTSLNLRDLIITANGGNGISAESGSDGMQISGCRIDQNSQAGLEISGSRNGFLIGNQISENRIGLSLSDSENFSLNANILKGNKINLDITGSTPAQYSHIIDRSNRADNREIWYLNGADGVSIGPSDNPACIYIIRGSDITISDLVFSKNGAGIFLIQSQNITMNRVASLENAFGIRIGYGSYDISLTNCSAEMNLIAGYAVSTGSNISYYSCSAQNNLAGFVASDSSRILYRSCSAERQDGLRKRGPSGFMISDCDQVAIINSTANQNAFDGIYLKNSTHVDISGTTLQTNAIAGLAALSDAVTISNSTVSMNKAGGVLFYGNDSVLTGSRISGNQGRGLIIDGSSGTQIWDNSFNNTRNVEITKSTRSTIWNISPMKGSAVFGSSYIGGNYWGNPGKTGFSDTCIPDAYGFCSAPYNPGGNDTDYYPLARYCQNTSISNSSVTVFSDSGFSGDINQNGRLDFDDVVHLMDLITGDQNVSIEYDFSDDGRVNLQDVIALFRVISEYS